MYSSTNTCMRRWYSRNPGVSHVVCCQLAGVGEAHVVDLKHNRVVVVFRRRRRAVRLALPLGRRGRASIARDLVTTRPEPCVRFHGGLERRRALGIVGRDELEELTLDVVRGRVLALELLVIANLEELLQAPAREVELASAPPLPLGIP